MFVHACERVLLCIGPPQASLFDEIKSCFQSGVFSAFLEEVTQIPPLLPLWHDGEK
jgi:hypothetical protein